MSPNKSFGYIEVYFIHREEEKCLILFPYLPVFKMICWFSSIIQR